MSGHVSTDVRLALGMVGSPLIALLNQQAIYSATMWACGHGLHAVLHIIPALCLLVALALAFDSYVIRRSMDRREGALTERIRFVALCGIAISVFSAVVIVAQWMSIFTFDPCMRA